ncbi:MAG: acetate kinase [Calditrichaeota bacterium]|nr:MAG: acetate kinase [Calditrichota bacterium]MBL1205793.1 acetate kinase [Calditrichota bacterium]NOG45621.1 acetate kinase [Calditrichota bacterium]
MNILVLNCGSSSVKFQLIETSLEQIEKSKDKRIARGILERIGSHSLITMQVEGQPKVRMDAPVRNHRDAIGIIMRWIISADSKIEQIKSYDDIHAVGHRIVHGGEKFSKSVKIDNEIIHGIEDYIELAPLHNPANIKGIRAATEILSKTIPQVAVFDTAFHSTMPDTSYLYGLPYPLYRRYKIRRYGFHGTSHRYVAYKYRQEINVSSEKVNIISLHLGNGASACSILDGESVDTSMGFTPLEGLLMGTRSGDIDVSILEYLYHKEGLTYAEFDTMLNKRSGLLGISGLTHDMRELLEEEAESGDRRATLAIDIFCKRVRKYIGSYFVEMGGKAEAIIFTGGIGENSPIIRERVCKGLDSIGLILDKKKNNALSGGKSGEITTKDSKLKAFVFPTNEELLIARDTFRVVENVPRRW